MKDQDINVPNPWRADADLVLRIRTYCWSMEPDPVLFFSGFEVSRCQQKKNAVFASIKKPQNWRNQGYS